jgi:hypothetical protein
MSTLIKRWDIVLQTKEALESDIRSGFLIINKGHDIHAIPLERIHYFGIIAVTAMADEMSLTAGTDGSHYRWFLREPCLMTIKRNRHGAN